MSGTGCALVSAQNIHPTRPTLEVPAPVDDRRNEPRFAGLHWPPDPEADRTWFIFAAAHDLQSPLRSLQASLQTLGAGQEDLLPPSSLEILNRATENISRMSRLVVDLLAYAKAGSPPEASCRCVNLQEPLQAALENLASEVEESEAIVSFYNLPEVWGDPGSLTRLFQNLIGNAIKFRRRGEPPRVEVRAALLGGVWNLSISDNGQGFEPWYAPKIFAPLRRLHGPEVPGTGLGLAVCQRIVEFHGGVIWANSCPGRGSTFCFTLPAYPATA